MKCGVSSFNTSQKGSLIFGILILVLQTLAVPSTCQGIDDRCHDEFPSAQSASFGHPYYSNIASVTFRLFVRKLYTFLTFPIAQGDFDAAILTLQQGFQAHNISFTVVGQEDYYIAEDIYYLDSSDINTPLNNLQRDADKMTMYITVPDHPKRVGEALWVYAPAGNGLAVGGTGIQGAIVHEMGHCLGLYHTFQGAEIPLSPYCASQGDEVCDTPPFPDGHGFHG